MNKKWITAVLTIAGLAVTAKADWVDNFNRADSTRNADASVSIGANYELAQVGGTEAVTAGILDNQVQFGSTDALGAIGVVDGMLLYKGLSLGDTTVSGNSWTVSGQIKTLNTVSGALTYGLVFNHQSDGSFYAARIDTGTDTTVLQFVRRSTGGVTAFASVTHTPSLATSSPYELSISSSSPGVFSYTMTGANITGSLTGTVTESSLNLNGGYAGFYSSRANHNLRFDNLEITVIPEPATLGLFVVSSAGLLLMRRLML